MKMVDVPGILAYGVIGLGFLLALLAYRLLSREQTNQQVREPMIRAIYIFMAFSVLLCTVGLVSEWSRSQPQPSKLDKSAGAQGPARTVNVEEGVPAYRFPENGVGVKVQSISACGDFVELSLYGPKDQSAEPRKIARGDVLPLSQFGDSASGLVVTEACAAQRWVKLGLKKLN